MKTRRGRTPLPISLLHATVERGQIASTIKAEESGEWLSAWTWKSSGFYNKLTDEAVDEVDLSISLTNQSRRTSCAGGGSDTGPPWVLPFLRSIFHRYSLLWPETFDWILFADLDNSRRGV